MSRIKSSDTQPEIALRKYLHRSGFRYRLKRKIAGRPDLVFPKQKIAIFVHGCFWHRHGCKNSTTPKTNSDFWTEKLKSNVYRDKCVLEKLRKEKWKAKVIWECQLEAEKRIVFKQLVNFLYKNRVKKNRKGNSFAM